MGKDLIGQALIYSLAAQARLRLISPDKWSNWIRLAQRSHPELASRMQEVQRAQQALDQLVLTLDNKEGKNG